MKINLIGIHTMNISTELIDFAKNGIYRTIPMILYKVNDEKIRYFLVKRPIEIFRENMDYRNLKSIVQGKDTSFLSLPGKAYIKMKNYANQNVNKVVADMITYIIVKIICELKKESPDSKNIFFIDSVDTNKIIGRLGYLYLDSEFNTISFVTYKSGGLLTDILNDGNEKLIFDINYFKKHKQKECLHSEIIPNDYMESLTQTVFFKLDNAKEQLSPLRFDILSQGISKNKIQEKVNDIGKVLRCPDNMALPHLEASGNSLKNNWVMIPRVLDECIEMEDMYKNIAWEILEEDLYG